MRRRGHLYVFEGPDGVGKTTLSRWLVGQLTQRDRKTIWCSFPGRKAGTLGNLVYRLHHKPARFRVVSINPLSLQMLHIAAHVDSIATEILPSLKAGISVVLDRFWWSTWVYGRCAGIDRTSLDALIDLEKRAWGMTKPTKLFLIRRATLAGGVRARRLHDIYLQLAHREAAKVAIATISNTGSIERTRRAILSLIE